MLSKKETKAERRVIPEDKNLVFLQGTLCSNFEPYSRSARTNYYKNTLAVRRRSGHVDYIPVVFSEEQVSEIPIPEGSYVSIRGMFRSKNAYDVKWHKRRLFLMVYAKEVTHGETSDSSSDTNIIYLTGTICKKPVFRKTPLGTSITDLTVAVDNNNIANYFPCLCWHDKAKESADLLPGTKINAIGCITSRNYIKTLNDEKKEERTAYEISFFKFDINKQ